MLPLSTVQPNQPFLRKTPKIRVLIVKNNHEITQPLKQSLEAEDLDCLIASNASNALKLIEKENFDFIILGQNLPDCSWYDFVEQINQLSFRGNFIMLSPFATPNEIVEALNNGIDDVMVAPIDTDLVIARIKSLFRLKSQEGTSVIQFGEIKLNPSEYKAWVNENLLSLTRTEFDILKYFILHPEQIISHETLAKEALAFKVIKDADFEFLYSHLKNLKKKISKHSDFSYIRSAYGQGYRFTML